MISVKFLVPPQFIDYDLSKPPSFNNQGGGMSVTFSRIEGMNTRKYDLQVIGDVDEIGDDDIVFADWLWFCSCQGKSIVDQAKRFIEISNPKIVHGSETILLTFPRNIVNQIVNNVLFVTHNTEYQKNLYRVMGIYNSRMLCDPIPESVFSPGRKKRKLVCAGQLASHKNSGAVVEIFKGLEGSGIERVYVGGLTLWGDIKLRREDHKIYENIHANADDFLENAKQSEIADVLSESAFYGHVSFHDTSSLTMQESMMAGNVVFGLGHPVLRERTPYQFKDTESLVKALLDYPFDSDKHKQDMAKTTTKAEEWSYSNWEEQLNSIIRLIFHENI